MIARSLAVACLGLLTIESAWAADVRLTVSRSDCDRIARHLAAPDVAYKAGMDVHGRPVAPADIEGDEIVIPERIFIYLSIPLNDLLVNHNPKLSNADAFVGAIQYDMASGRMYFNDEELADPALNAIAVECRKRYP